MSWIGTAVVGASALAKGVTGAIQNGKASAIEKQNIRPTQYVDPAYEQNVAQAQQMALQGTPQQQYNNSLNNINQNLSGGLQLLGRSANPGAGLASLIRGQNAATMSLDAQSAAMRNQNILNLMRQRAILAQQKQAAFDWNKKSKYTELLSKSQALRSAGSANIAGAFGDIGNAGALYASSRLGGFGKTAYNGNNAPASLDGYGNLSGYSQMS